VWVCVCGRVRVRVCVIDKRGRRGEKERPGGKASKVSSGRGGNS